MHRKHSDNFQIASLKLLGAFESTDSIFGSPNKNCCQEKIPYKMRKQQTFLSDMTSGTTEKEMQGYIKENREVTSGSD